MNRVLGFATNLFPIWVLLGGALALAHPARITWFNGNFITWGLAVIMLGVGITLSADDFKRSGGELILAVFLLHSGGFFLGYAFSRLPRCDKLTSRTISVEVGMQNSGLGTALAKAHFARCP